MNFRLLPPVCLDIVVTIWFESFLFRQSGLFRKLVVHDNNHDDHTDRYASAVLCFLLALHYIINGCVISGL